MRVKRQRVGVAVVGCGGIARQYHLRALQACDAARVVAVADPDPQARDAAAAAAGARTRAYADGHEAIEQGDVDAVVVCAPNSVHAELATAALEAGRHVYLEKPLATNAVDGRRVVDAAERAGTVAAIGFAFRFDPLYARARALLRDGALGELRTVSTSFAEPHAPGGPGWKRTRAAGGGALLDLGVHHLDLLAWLTGDTLGTVDWAELSSLAAEHDSASVHGQLTGGADFEASFGYAATRRCAWAVAGDDGWLAIDRGTRRLTLARRGDRPRSRRRADALRRRINELPVIRRERVFGRALRAWVDGAAGGSTSGLPSLLDGLRALEAVEAIEAAAEPVHA